MNIDDVYDGRKVSELIAEGEYKSSKEEILRSPDGPAVYEATLDKDMQVIEELCSYPVL